MVNKVKVTLKELKDYLKKKRDKCNKTHGKSLAEDLLNDPNHPVSKFSNEDFSLRRIFDYIQIDYGGNNTNRSSSEQ